jgi:hypothetical protein
MTPSSPAAPVKAATPVPDLAKQWSSALRLHPIYNEMAREFSLDVPASAAFRSPSPTPDPAKVEQAQLWLAQMDERLQVHQLRQFIQTSSLVDREAMVEMIRHFLAKPTRSPASRDKLDFLLVQYFSQAAPSDLADERADLSYVAHGLESVLGSIDAKPPVWLNALERILESAKRCRSLDELLHGGVLEQGRKAKTQAGDLFYMPVALVAFTRYGYLMRRAFFRLMLTDLNHILDGLAELQEQGVETIDCRRAQFSQQEPINRLRVICQSWKVMFQAEYSSGQPLRMLVDLRASVDCALGRGTGTESGEPAPENTAAPKAQLSKAAAASATKSSVRPLLAAPAQAAPPQANFAVASDEPPEFEISADTPEWNPDENQPGAKKK